jgi:uncharacterized YccA/Bax inhibitor family protein
MANPTLREEVFNSPQRNDSLELDRVMTSSGAMLKTCILALFVALTFGYSWSLISAGFMDKASILLSVGAIGGFIMAMIICFAPKNNYLAVTTPVYAMLEGLFLGGISAVFNQMYPGIVFQAALGTILTIFGMFILYNTRIIKVDDNFMKAIFIATFAIAGIYIVQWILSIFHLTIPGIFTNSPIGIAFSVVVVCIAAFNLLIDFNFIETYSGRAPKYMEWYGGFALMVTIVWLYLEILKLLAKISSRR